MTKPHMAGPQRSWPQWLGRLWMWDVRGDRDRRMFWSMEKPERGLATAKDRRQDKMLGVLHQGKREERKQS